MSAMLDFRRLAALSGCAVVAACASFAVGETGSVSWPLAARHADPKEFGVQDETRTVISAMSFWPAYGTTPNLARYCNACTVVIEYYANLEVPAGAIIDFIGVNNATDADAVMGVALWLRDAAANRTLLTGYSFPAHDWDTDMAGPLAILVPDHIDKELVLNIEQAVSPTPEYFGWVEVWWHRTVSPPPSTATFTDVPTDHPFFQFIEAIAAAGISAGCGGGNFCPDQAITRKQEAAFLAKALGLHWPN
jgi:hypothetical protein